MNNNQQCLTHREKRIQYISYDIRENSQISFKCADCLEDNRHNGSNIQLEEFKRKAKEYFDKFQHLQIEIQDYEKRKRFDFQTSFLQEKIIFRYKPLSERIKKLKDFKESVDIIMEESLHELKILVYSMERDEYTYLEKEWKILKKELQPIIFRNSDDEKFYECIGEFKDENNGKGQCRSEFEIKEGIIINGQLEGLGYYQKGDLIMQGWFIKGKLNGKGQQTLVDKNNGRIIKEEGYFKNNLLNGSGTREINGVSQNGRFLKGVLLTYDQDLKKLQPKPLKNINQGNKENDRQIKKSICFYCLLQNADLTTNEYYIYCPCGVYQCKKCLGQFTNHHNKKYNIFRCPQSTKYPYLKRLIYMFPRLFMLLISILWSPFSSINCDSLIILIASMFLVLPLLSKILIEIPGSIHRYLCS